MPISGKVIVHDEIVRRRLLAAAPRILEHNRALVEIMLREIKTVVIAQTPIGPGHFGYHLRDSYVTEIHSKGVVTKGVLKAPAQGYWREYGTKGRSRKLGSALGLSGGQLNKAFNAGGLGDGGERAFMTAHKALAGVRKFISAWYGGMASWWRI